MCSKSFLWEIAKALLAGLATTALIFIVSLLFSSLLSKVTF